MSTPSMKTEHRTPPIEISHGGHLWALTFTADGEYLLGSTTDKIQVWRAKDGKEIASLKATSAQCLAVSPDGRWIAAGTARGYTLVWDAKTREQVLEHGRDDESVLAVDFSPDGTRLVSAPPTGTAIVFDMATHKQIQTLPSDEKVVAAKYAPHGDWIATATVNSVRVWDSNDGHFLAEILVKVTPGRNKGLLWLNNHILVVSGDKIKQFEASTGLIVSEWQLQESDYQSCIALPKRQEFIAHSTRNTVTFWDRNTHTQLGLIRHTKHIASIAFSPDGWSIAIGGKNERITIHRLSVFTPSVRLHDALQEIDMEIDDDVLDCWTNNQLENAEALLTTVISAGKPTHRMLANRALVRARLGKWDNAVTDATKSLEIEPSALAYIAKSVAHIGKGETHKAYRACDIALWSFRSKDNPFLLLIKAIIVSMAGEHEDAISRIDDLIRIASSTSACYTVQSYMLVLFSDLHMKNSDYNGAIQFLERARDQMRPITDVMLPISLISGWTFNSLKVTIQCRLCEVLYAVGRVKEAGESLVMMLNTIQEDIDGTGSITTWVSDFLQRYLSVSESCDDAPFYPPTSLLREWVKSKLAGSGWKEALASTLNFIPTRVTIYRALCDHLESINRVTEAIECFHQMKIELAEEKEVDSEQVDWVADFTQRCTQKLECLGDIAADTQRYKEAISHYSAALSLSPIVSQSQSLLAKQSKAHAGVMSWQDALNDANEAILLDRSHPSGYESKYIALRGAGSHSDAINAFEEMLSVMSQSSDPEVCRRHRSHEEAKAAIRAAIKNTIRESPQRLINTNSGHLVDKATQARSFETQPVFLELISASTPIDRARIDREVADYYRYAMFSHKWEDSGEPPFEKVTSTTVYDLEESHTHDKLKMFCKIARDSGLCWAWSDTCCINKGNHLELQEALMMMFKWYEGGAVTIVSLRGVHFPSKRGDLTKSIWNTRVWTYQEYHASKVVRFYTEDWKPYLELNDWNHKESPDIIAEMEEATGVLASVLMALRPGLDDIQEKLRLASTRKTTRVEDEAYSLLGIFSMSLPVVYGEGDKALGRFLAQLLTNSGDASVLAWTGKSGSFNSCLPSNIVSFNRLPTSHIPKLLESAEMDTIIARLRSSSLNSTSLIKLHDQLHDLPVPMFAGQRMKLPCIALKLGRFSVTRDSSGFVFHAQTVAGAVEIVTDQNLSQFNSLYLIHPWIDALLNRYPVGGVVEVPCEESTEGEWEPRPFPGPSGVASAVPQRRASRMIARLPFSRRATQSPLRITSLRPSSISPRERTTHALEMLARLSQPFGALLLAQSGRTAYRRVAMESLITFRIEEITPAMLDKLIGCVRTMDVL